VDHHAVLDIRIGTDGDRVHVTVGVDFVGADHRVRADKYVFADDHLAADDCGFVDVGRFGNHGQIAGRVLADHGSGSLRGAVMMLT
jgi:hypothetical protein